MQRVTSILGFVGFVLATDLPAQDGKSATWEEARQVLQTHCFQCHGKDGTKKGGMGFILEPTVLLQEGIVVKGKSAESPIYTRMTSDKRPMPPRDVEARPTQAEIDVIRSWIEGGATLPSPQAFRRTILLGDQLKQARDHVRPDFPDDRRFFRYFSIAHLHNLNPTRLSDEDLQLHRLALIKLLNSLSWRGDMVEVFVVDAERTLFAVDLRDLNWSPTNEWHRIEEAYPYGLQHDSASLNRSTSEIAKELYESTGTSLPIIRADWFIANASQPPLYHQLLRIPNTDQELEKRLEVDVAYNIARGKAKRAGFLRSGVSDHNRLVERHGSLTGGYWKSYDFKSSAGNQNLAAKPLGPPWMQDRFRNAAFQHDGGEIIFALPNGLQGYMLVDAGGRRIDAGPIEVVHDDNRASGSPVIKNGLSCMACHSQGMIDLPSDIVGAAHGFRGEARDLIERLYPGDKIMRQWIERDRRRFQDSMQRALAPLVGSGETYAKSPEPVSAVARRYFDDLDLESAAIELFVSEQDLAGALRLNDSLRKAGLGALTENARIKRETWEGFLGLHSAFQLAALELDIGTPYRRTR